jgi:hypothetical protein
MRKHGRRKGKKGQKLGRLEEMEVGTVNRDRYWPKRFRPSRNAPLYVLTAKQKIISRTYRTSGTLIVKCRTRLYRVSPVSRYRRVCRICSSTKTNALALDQSHVVDVFASVNGDKHFFKSLQPATLLYFWCYVAILYIGQKPFKRLKYKFQTRIYHIHEPSGCFIRLLPAAPPCGCSFWLLPVAVPCGGSGVAPCGWSLTPCGCFLGLLPVVGPWGWSLRLVHEVAPWGWSMRLVPAVAAAAGLWDCSLWLLPAACSWGCFLLLLPAAGHEVAPSGCSLRRVHEAALCGVSMRLLPVACPWDCSLWPLFPVRSLSSHGENLTRGILKDFFIAADIVCQVLLPHSGLPF